MPKETQRLKITDLARLKALAHPLRMRIFELLAIEGSANASALADHLDEPVSLVSYHLHQLGRFGYAVEAPELARDSRERWWRPVAVGVSWSSADFLDDPGARATASAAWRVNIGRRVDRTQSFHDAIDAWGKDWADASMTTDRTIQLSPDELREMANEVNAVLVRWQDRELPDDDVVRERVFTVFDAVPVRL